MTVSNSPYAFVQQQEEEEQQQLILLLIWADYLYYLIVWLYRLISNNQSYIYIY